MAVEVEERVVEGEVVYLVVGGSGMCAAEYVDAVLTILKEIPPNGVYGLDFEDQRRIMQELTEMLAGTSSSILAFAVAQALLGRENQSEDGF